MSEGQEINPEQFQNNLRSTYKQIGQELINQQDEATKQQKLRSEAPITIRTETVAQTLARRSMPRTGKETVAEQTFRGMKQKPTEVPPIYKKQ